MGRLSPGLGAPEEVLAGDAIAFVGLDVLFTDTGTIEFTYDSGTNKYLADYVGALNNNSDVDAASPNDMEVLTWVAANSAWEHQRHI